MNGLYLENGSLAVGAFDFDGNILNMPTTYNFFHIPTGKVVEILSTEVDQNPEKYFNNSDYKYVNGNKLETVCNFTDSSGFTNRGFNGLIKDLEKALNNNSFSKSFETFKNLFLIKGRIFSIITARGNSPDNLKMTLDKINDVVFSNEERKLQEEAIRDNFGYTKAKCSTKQVYELYFRDEIIDYIPCNNPFVKRMIGIDDGSHIKVQAMEWWIKEVHRKLIETGIKFNKKIEDIINEDTPVSIGFSDDSLSIIIAMVDYFSEKITELGTKYKGRIFYTGIEGGIPEIEKKLPSNAETKKNEENFEIRFG